MAADFIKLLAKEWTSVELSRRIAKAAEDYSEGIFTSDYNKLYSSLHAFRNSIPKKTFAEGIAYGLAGMLYNKSISSRTKVPKYIKKQRIKQNYGGSS
jgi:hypothetical protein